MGGTVRPGSPLVRAGFFRSCYCRKATPKAAMKLSSSVSPSETGSDPESDSDR